MENYAIAHITDRIVTKGEKYPILSIEDGIIDIDVNGKTVCVSDNDKDFTFYINQTTKIIDYIKSWNKDLADLAEFEDEEKEAIEVHEKCIRAFELLKACHDLLQKQVDSHYVLNLLEETVYYDDANCDGRCLMEDIKDVLGMEE